MTKSSHCWKWHGNYKFPLWLGTFWEVSQKSDRSLHSWHPTSRGLLQAFTPKDSSQFICSIASMAWLHMRFLNISCMRPEGYLARRLTLYPEFALQPGKWLDSSRGRNSVSAAVFRHSDVHGLLRGSEWVAGQTTASQQPSSPSSNDSLQPALSLENKTEIEGLEKAAPKVIAAGIILCLAYYDPSTFQENGL